MFDKEDESKIMSLYDDIKSHFLERVSKGDIETGVPISIIHRDLLRICKFFENQSIENSDLETAYGYVILANEIRKNKSFTPTQVLDLLSKIKNISQFQRFSASSRVPDYYTELRERMGYFEHKLAEMKSNPELEKKVAELEKRLREIQVEEVKGKEKEKKDMLKEYKEAKKRAFVVMPFAPTFDDVWKGGIERACEKEGMGYLRVDKISLSSWITKDIINYIDMADFVIADITGNNPNVMFEFGWALALKKKPIVIREQNDKQTLPFDVKDIRYLPYINSWSGIEKLSVDLCNFLKSTSQASEEATDTKTNSKKKK